LRAGIRSRAPPPIDTLVIDQERAELNRLTDRVDYWLKLEDRLNRELSITKTLHTPVNFIVHTLQEVNDGLAHGRYFFMICTTRSSSRFL
jgi:hypothetical protein